MAKSVMDSLSKVALGFDAEVLTQRDFKMAFKRLTDLMKEVNKKNASLIRTSITEMQRKIDNLSDELEGNSKTRLEKEMAELKAQMDKMMREQERTLNFVRDKASSLRDGLDGTDADEDRVIAEVVKTLTPQDDRFEEMKKELFGFGENLTSLEEAMKKELERLGGRVLLTGQNPSNIRELAVAETPDGAITDFTFAEKPSYIVVNGLTYREDNGWSWGSDGVTATLDFAPPTNSDVYGMV